MTMPLRSRARRGWTCALALILMASLSSGCASTRVATPVECALIGAAALGGAGGVVGAEVDEDHDNTDVTGPAVGAAVGALVGAGTGYLICSMLPEAKPAPKPAAVAPAPKPAPPPPPPPPRAARIVLRGVNFAHDSDKIDASSAVVLDVAAETLRSNAGVNVAVEGHTDSVGTDAYNASLSERRANAVRDYLVRAGVEESRLQTTGYGESRPVASNDNADGRRMNRRVELKILE